MLNRLVAAILSFASGPGAFVFGLLAPFMVSHGVLAYFVILVLNAAFAGPLLMIQSSRLMVAAHLGFLPMVAAVTVGDALNDRFYYWVGRTYGTRIPTARKWRDRAQHHLRNRPVATLLVAKVFYGPGIAALVGAGEARVPYVRHFAPACLVSSLAQALLYLCFGPALSDLLHVWTDIMMTAVVLGACLLLIKITYSMYLYRVAQMRATVSEN